MDNRSGTVERERGRPRRGVLLVALSLGCLLTLTACGGKGDPSGGSSAADYSASEPSETSSGQAAPSQTTASPSAPAPWESSSATETPTVDDSISPEASADDGDSGPTDDTDGSESSEDSGAEASDVARGQWTGTAQITVDFTDPGCAPASQTYQLPATLLISEPVKGESNGFHLSWASDSQSAPGAFGLTSASDGTDTVDGQPVAIGYWSLSDDGDGDISGNLTQDGASQGAALNLVFVPKPIFPCSNYMPYGYAMSSDTTLEGTVTDSSASLVLRGTTTEGTRSFRIEWS